MTSPNVHTCPIREVAELLSDTWTMLIMRGLTEGPKRFTELHTWLGSISSRTLTAKLQKLTAQGLIEKRPDGTYAPTEKGAGLKLIERAMLRYSEEYLK